MAKRKKKSSRRRRRGMSGFSAKGVMNTFTPVLITAAGAIGQQILTNNILKNVKMDEKLKSLIPIGAGLMMTMMDKKNGMIAQLGAGMMVGGTISSAKMLIPGLTGITDADITGIEEEITVGDISIDGYDEDDMIEGPITVGGAEEIYQ